MLAANTPSPSPAHPQRFTGRAARITFPVAEDPAHDAALATTIRRLQAS